MSYRSLISNNANFRYLWFGQIISNLGDWFNVIASSTLVAMLTGSGVAVGALFVVQLLAPFIVSPFAGVLTDNYNRKRLLIITDILRGLTLIGFLFVRDAEDIWLLFVLTAIQFAISGFFFPTRNALIPELVESDGLGAANALSSATWSVMLALGTAIGGLVAGSFGVYTAYILDSLTFFISALVLTKINYQPAIATVQGESKTNSFLTQYIDGLRYLKEHLDIFAIVLHKAAVSMIMFSSSQVINVALAGSVFVFGEGGGTGLGLMFAVIGVGTGLGPLWLRRYTGDKNSALRKSILLAYLIAAIGLIIAAPLWSFESYLLGNLIRGIGSGIIWVFSTQLLMQIVPRQMQGRIFATEFALFTLMGAVGSALTGWGVDNFTGGIPGLIWIMAAASLVAGLIWWRWVHNKGMAEADSTL